MTDKYEALRQDLQDAGEYFGCQNPAPRVKVIQDLLSERNALAAQVEALSANSDRYLWATANEDNAEELYETVVFYQSAQRDIDRIIDAARKEQQP